MEVGQFIYTRLEKSESPHGVGGFQTMCYTHGLIPETLMVEIESLLRCDTGRAEPQLIFHPVGEQQVVLVQLQPIADVDNCGRGGNFVANGVVLQKDQFLALGGNPITLAQCVPFIASREDADAQGILPNGDIPPLQISTDLISNPREFVRSVPWKGAQLRNLLVLAVTLSSPEGQHRPVALHGTTDRILDTLQLVYELLPSTLRPTLSFATHCQRLERGGASLQGFRAAPLLDGCAEINATDCVADTGEEPKSSFLRWVRKTKFAETAADFACLSDCCWWLGCLVDGGHSDDIYFDNCDEVAKEFWQLNLDACRRRLLAVYERRVGRALAQRAMKHLLLQHRPRELFAQIDEGGNHTALAAALHPAYCESAEPAGREERNQVARFLKRFGDGQFADVRLSVWLAIWTGDWPLVQRWLQKLPDRDLTRLVAEMADVPYLDIATFLISGREAPVVAGLLGPDAASARQPRGTSWMPGGASLLGQLNSFSDGRLAKLARLISVEPELIDSQTTQAVASECERRGATQFPKSKRFRWWRSR